MARRVRKNQHQKQGIREYLIAAGLFVVVCLLAWAVWGIAQKEEIARSAMNERKAELAQLEARRDAFAANLDELSTMRGQEATLRQNHGVAKAGEEVIIVVPNEEEDMQPHQSPWERFLSWIQGR